MSDNDSDNQKRVWMCSCGEEFPEYGKMTNHIMSKGRYDPDSSHSAVGLVDQETGELLIEGQNVKKAIELGYVKPKDKSKGKKEKSASANGKPKQTSSGSNSGSNTLARIRFQNIEIDPALWILFDLARIKWPEEYDDNAESFSLWLTECIFRLYMDYSDELGFEGLLERSLQKIMKVGEKDWESQVS